MMSVADPAVNGTTMRTGCLGYWSWAVAGESQEQVASAMEASLAFGLKRFMDLSRWFLDSGPVGHYQQQTCRQLAGVR